VLPAIPLALVALSLAAQPLTFADALARAEQRNPELVPLQLAVPQAEADAQAAGAMPNPTFSFSVGPDEPTVFGAVDQKLPIFGQRSSAIAAGRAQVPIAEGELAARKLQLRAEVRRSYHALAAAQAQLGLAEETARLSGEIADMTAKKFEVGSAPQLDVEQADLARKRAVQDLEDRKAALSSARIRLAASLGEDPEAELEASDPLVPLPQVASLSDLLGRAGQHPEVQVAEREREAALARARREKLSLVPAPSLSLEVEHLGNPPGVGVRGGLAFDLPLLSWNGGAIRSEELQADRAVARGMAARRRLAAAARESWSRWEAAVRRVRFAADQLVPSAQKVAQLARVGYDVGRTPLANVVLAESEVAATRSRAIEAAAEAWSALADLEEAVGAIP
jgi:cobalt-zinc-cadmium efflux system outer membrane protein